MTFLKKNKKLFIVLSLLLILGLSTYTYVFKETATVAVSKPEFKGTSEEFISNNSTQISEWNAKVIEITGIIFEINDEGVLIDENVFCQFSEHQDLKKLKKNQSVTIKGMVVGYDDLLNELKLNQCTLKN